MGLLDDAAEIKASRVVSRSCVMARAISNAIPEKDLGEVRDLLRSKDFDSVVKWETLVKNGVDVAKSTVQGKMLAGCKCVWCAEYAIVGPGK